MSDRDDGRPEPPLSTLGRGRDAPVVQVANVVLRCGSPWIQAMVKGSIQYGLRAAAEDARPDLMRDRAPREQSGGPL